MAKQRPFIINRDGFWLEWFSRRNELECNVYMALGVVNDGAICGLERGELVVELSYPKVSGVGFTDFTPEAASIARKKLEERDAARKEADGQGVAGGAGAPAEE